MNVEPLPERIDAIRRFNRLYTRRIGLLQSSHLGTQYSLTEARVLFELGQRPAMTAKDLCGILELDQGYVSRILARFEKKGLISRRASDDDGRMQHVVLSKAGQKTYTVLDDKARDAIAALLDGKAEEDQRALASAARTFEDILRDEPSGSTMIIRPPRSGDLGWIVYRHGVLYAQEYGWDITFEGVVAEIITNFAKRNDPARERCWVAERNGEIVGAVFLVSDDAQTARLRLLYVEPSARGHGLGKQLVGQCVGFAREAGYRKIVLWTHDVLTSARKLYQEAGFRLIESEPRRSFGVDVVSEIWELEFRPQSVPARPQA